MSETIIIKTTREKFFSEYLIIKKPFLNIALSILNNGSSKLTKMPLLVYAQLLYYSSLYKYNDGNSYIIDWGRVFSRITKKKICSNLNMTEHLLNIYITQLRGMKILDKKTISKPFLIDIGKDNELSFKFVFNGNE